MMVTVMNVADFVDPHDPQGRTYRQVNAAMPHNVAVGSLVELQSGVRLFVVYLSRDCDQTPLYYLSEDPEDTTQKSGFKNPSWVGGFSEYSFTLIKGPQ